MTQGTRLALAVLTTLLGFAQPAIAQKAHSYSLAPKRCKNLFVEYDYALDQLFPRGVPPKGVRSRDVDYTIVLRYLPSFQAESQIVIIKQVNGTLDVVRYGLRRGDQSIWAQLNRFYQNQSCPTDADIRNINVVITNLKPVPDEVKQTVVGLFERPVTLVIDPNMRPDLTPKDHRYLMEDGETVYFGWTRSKTLLFLSCGAPGTGSTISTPRSMTGRTGSEEKSTVPVKIRLQQQPLSTK